jgi:chaperonin cofactor prefoldin
MKKTVYGVMILVCSVVLLVGCVSTKGVKKTSKADLSENELYAQVPEQYHGPVEEAKANQLAAAEQLKYAEELVALSELEKEMATKKEKLSNLQHKLDELAHKEAILRVDLTQWEAIDKAGLGDKEKNIKTIYGLRSKIAKNQTSRLSVQKDYDTLDLRIKKLSEQIKVQQEKVATMRSVLQSGGTPAPAASAGAD